MNLQKVYRLLVSMHPRAYRELFAAEILAVLQERTCAQRGIGRIAFARFALAEITGLAIGVVRERVARRGAPAARVASGDEAGAIRARIEWNLRRMDYAIAHHDFPGTRFYAEEDRKDRERLRRFLSDPGI